MFLPEIEDPLEKNIELRKRKKQTKYDWFPDKPYADIFNIVASTRALFSEDMATVKEGFAFSKQHSRWEFSALRARVRGLFAPANGPALLGER